MNKKLFTASLLLLFATLLISCTSVTKDVNVSLVVDSTIAADADFVHEALVTIDERANAGACFTKYLDSLEIAHEGFSDGFVTKIDSYPLEGNYSWMFYINGELADVGVNDYIPENGDSISLVYTDWTKVIDLGE